MIHGLNTKKWSQNCAFLLLNEDQYDNVLYKKEDSFAVKDDGVHSEEIQKLKAMMLQVLEMSVLQ